MTELNDKAIDIKGKKYVLVSDRILAFNAEYPKGSIVTELLSQPDAELVVMKATVYPQGSDQYIKFVGHSQAKWGDGYINKTSALENCETSAVGRALAMMGIGVIDSIASADEMVKAGATVTSQPTVTEPKDLNLWCDVHHCDMKLNKNGKPYHLSTTGEFCNGMGFPSDPRFQRSVNKSADDARSNAWESK